MGDAKRDMGLVVAWKQGNRVAGDKLFSETYESILKYVNYALCSYVIPNKQDVIEEIVEEAFTRAIKKIKEYDGSVTFYTWIRGFACNCIKEKIRELTKANNNESIDDYYDNELAYFESELPDFANPEYILIKKEEYETIQKIILSLPEHYREILDLRIIKGMKNKDIAAMQGKHEDNIESLFYRALKAFKEEFKKNINFF